MHKQVIIQTCTYMHIRIDRLLIRGLYTEFALDSMNGPTVCVLLLLLPLSAEHGFVLLWLRNTGLG